MTTNSKTRLHSFDLLKLFTIFLVIWGHCVQHFLSGNPTNNPVYQYIYSFHMPLFMIISGYFAYSSMQISLKELLAKKSIQLLLPCISWGILWWLREPLGISAHHESDSLLTDLIILLKENFWFLKSLFICYIVTYMGGGKLWYSILAIIFFLFIPRYSLPIMYPCFVTGIYLRKYTNQPRLKLSSAISFLPVAAFGVLLFYWNYDFLRSDTVSLKDLINGNMENMSEYLTTTAYRIATGIAGSISFILLFNTLFGKERQGKAYDRLAEWGTYTLGIYILQHFILERFLVEFVCCDSLPPILFNFVIAPVFSVAILLCCIFITKMLKKSETCSLFLLGMQKRKNKTT